MNNTLRERHIDREGYTWTINVAEVRGHTPFARQATLRRGKELWATIKLRHTGKFTTIPVLPSCHIPESVMTEVKKDLGVTSG